MRLSPALIALLFVSACASRTVWIKEGADADQLRRDQAECGSRGQDYRFVDERLPTRPGPIAADIYRECMEKRGWHRDRGRS